MHRIVTNSNTMTSRAATPAEVIEIETRRAEAAADLAGCRGRYAAARAKVIGWAPTFKVAGFHFIPGSIDSADAFEKACRKMVGRQVIAANPYGEGIHTRRIACERNPTPAQWADAAEAVAEMAEPMPAWMRASAYDQAAGW